ncbi:MATE family efflux transporter [Pendulispora albinea]|uniref:Multidrug-efflux transporter n=1 Tax=Pendulispora albinea TaxID=2741071 RepID=A0ABZ2M689_9BACT
MSSSTASTSSSALPRPSSIRHELRALAGLSAPISLAQVLLILIHLVDTSVLGRVSVEDLAGASIGRSLGFAAGCIGMGIAMALEPLASQALGAKEPERAWKAYRVNLRLGVLVWIPTVSAALLATFLLPLLGLEPIIVERARAYLLGQAPGMAATIAFLSTKTLLQAHGITGPAFAGACLANVSNVVFCNLLVRGDDALRSVNLPPLGLPRLGAFGAGLASTLAYLVLVSFVGGFALRQRRKTASQPAARAPGDPAATTVSMGTMVKLGTPIGLQLLAEIGVFTMASLLSASFGAKVAAAHQIALALATFAFMGAIGISGATAVRVGLAVGAGQSARRPGLTGILLGGTVMTVPAIVFWSIPEHLASIFTSDPEVIALGARLLRIAAIFQLFDGVQGVAAGALRGAGDVRVPFVVMLIAHWCVGLPTALLFGFVLGAQARGIWWGLTAGLIAVSLALVWRFLRISRGTIARV